MQITRKVALHVSCSEFEKLQKARGMWCVVREYEPADGTCWGTITLVGTKDECVEAAKTDEYIILPDSLRSVTKKVVSVDELLPQEDA